MKVSSADWIIMFMALVSLCLSAWQWWQLRKFDREMRDQFRADMNRPLRRRGRDMAGMKDTLGDELYQPPIFDSRESTARRDAGRAKVATPNATWMDGILALIRSLPPGWIGLLEDVRRQYQGPPPSHPNAWGSVATMAIRRGLLTETGVWRAASSVDSHARRMPEYRRTGT